MSCYVSGRSGRLGGEISDGIVRCGWKRQSKRQSGVGSADNTGGIGPRGRVEFKAGVAFASATYDRGGWPKRPSEGSLRSHHEVGPEAAFEDGHRRRIDGRVSKT